MSKSTFKNRYDNDPEFRETHLSYMKEKVECEGCGKMILRCNMSRHIKTESHKKNSVNNLQLSVKSFYP